MVEECMDKVFFFSRKPCTPKDKLIYTIPSQAIRDTERILTEYAEIEPSNEGLVYWGGTKIKDRVLVRAVIAPKTKSNSGRVFVSHRSNFDFIGALAKLNLLQVAQVHSHPTRWVGHSYGDDQMAAFKTEGLLSIVVPIYCKKGMLPLTKCGIHRFIKGEFKRFSKKYVKNHFQRTDMVKSVLEDFRK
jgi:hypothetical protein